MYTAIRKLLFRLDPETAHDLTMGALRHLLGGPLGARGRRRPPLAPRRVMGLDFPNPVGLAAGLDKDGDCIDALAALGFGYLEVGTVTPRPQTGNPPPRLFRLPAAAALINRMGFNNQGVEHLVRRVREMRYKGILGINIGKNRDTPLERAVEDYLLCLRQVYPLAGYITVNISSPNTPGLRELQFGAALDGLLTELKAEQQRLADRHGRYVPLAIKVAPDLGEPQVTELAQHFRRHRIDAVIAGNTTMSREGVEGQPHAEQAGGLSGAPLAGRARHTGRLFLQALAGEIPLISVGGIMDAEEAMGRLRDGAALLQIYTGFIYRGPRLIREIAAAAAATNAGKT